MLWLVWTECVALWMGWDGRGEVRRGVEDYGCCLSIYSDQSIQEKEGAWLCSSGSGRK